MHWRTGSRLLVSMPLLCSTASLIDHPSILQLYERAHRQQVIGERAAVAQHCSLPLGLGHPQPGVGLPGSFVAAGVDQRPVGHCRVHLQGSGCRGQGSGHRVAAGMYHRPVGRPHVHTCRDQYAGICSLQGSGRWSNWLRAASWQPCRLSIQRDTAVCTCRTGG